MRGPATDTIRPNGAQLDLALHKGPGAAVSPGPATPVICPAPSSVAKAVALGPGFAKEDALASGVAPAPVPESLQSLLRILHVELAESGFDSASVDTSRIQAVMDSWNVAGSEAQWAEYAHFSPSSGYTRNLVDDGNGLFNVMVLCWNPGSESPIHDHPKSHCIMKILSGSLQETQFRMPCPGVDSSPDCSMVPLCGKALHANETTYISDKIGLHRVGNPSSTSPAVSLHLYCPPYPKCHIYKEDTGKSTLVGSSPNRAFTGPCISIWDCSTMFLVSPVTHLDGCQALSRADHGWL